MTTEIEWLMRLSIQISNCNRINRKNIKQTKNKIMITQRLNIAKWVLKNTKIKILLRSVEIKNNQLNKKLTA